ncbi:hypothetical protein IUJ34_19955 [Klebsiella pneumoniae subsp. pneumoniae]|uniref:Uncharacterized protein n=1 Tax=Klebsiella pneumoniae subsp. pneumoniae TaxID=72407 RepID=A0A7S9E0Q1_KLEPN|nr:hypothetical protein IUJ34_19955 [Klebsiella pneumoniae subsp. pneumoniae]
MQAAHGRTGLLFSIRLQVDICLVPQTVPQRTAAQHYGLIQQMDSWYPLSGFSSGIAKVPTGVSDGDWIFVALAMSTTGMLIYIGNSDVVPVTGTYTAPTTTKYHGVGDCYHAGSNFYGATLEHASHGIHASAKSQSDLDGIYTRVKPGCLQEGSGALK